MPTLPAMDPHGVLENFGQTCGDAIGLASSALPESLTEAVGSYNPLLEPRGLGFDPNFNASAILAKRQQYQLQVIASTFSSVSILAALCALYWFCMMRRNFRRDLVLLLIIGDFWKSTWFLVFSAVTLSTGEIPTHSSFCQASGYFLQVGIEACDVAILLMSLHMSLQIFPPTRSYLSHDGLYRVRHLVVAGWFVVPNVIVSLAFVNSGWAFVSQGGFCTLPIRPIWYRLALSWIPRYLIWVTVMGVAIRIYRHVGYEFKVFGQENDQSSSVGIPNGHSANTHPSSTVDQGVLKQNLTTHSDDVTVEKQLGEDEVAPDDESAVHAGASKNSTHGSARSTPFSPGRRQSVPNWTTPFRTPSFDNIDPAIPGSFSPTSKSLPSSRRGSRQIGAGMCTEDFAPPPIINLDRTRGSVSTAASAKSHEPSSPALAPIKEHRVSASTATSLPENAATRAMQQRRRAVQRQLRLLFIYPVVYLMLWVMPFVAHALNYSDYFAQHRIFAVAALNFFCQSIMGFTDVCIFCWREKPWRHIPGSDGTFLGSFCFWRFAFSRQWVDDHRRRSSALDSPSEEKDQDLSGSSPQNGLLNSIKRWSMSISGGKSTHRPSNASISAQVSGGSTPRRVPMHRRTHSGGGDRRLLEAERAQERLQMERADWQQNRRSFNERRTRVISGSQQQQQNQSQSQGLSEAPARPERKEWWDRQMSLGVDFNDDDGDDGSNTHNNGKGGRAP